MNIEFKRGFNWMIGAITGVVVAIILFAMAASMIMGAAEIYHLWTDL